MNKNLYTIVRDVSGSFTILNYFRVRAGLGPDLVGPLTTLHDFADKLPLLVLSCVGEAQKYIEGLMCTNAELGYLEARKILNQIYGQARHVVINAHMQGLTDCPLIRASDFKALAQLARDMRNCLVTCIGIDGSGLDTQHTVGSIFQRLPKGLQDKFMAVLVLN